MNKLFFQFLRSSMVRYLIIAVAGVLIELALFAFMNSVLGISYLIATPLSTALVIVYNWQMSRIYVFKTSRHSLHKEFMLILIASLIGIGIQVIVTAIMVERLHQLPIFGKVTAICVTFFWNYWFRRKYIFPIESESAGQSVDANAN